MASDAKWTYLAELAHMIIDWDKVLEEIYSVIKDNNVVSEVATESEEENEE